MRRSAPISQSDFDAGGLRYGQNIFNLDLSREYELGFAKPLSVAVGAEHRQEQFKIRPGDLQSWAIGPLFRRVDHDRQRRIARRSRAYSMRRPTSAASRAARLRSARRAFPGIPDNSATDEIAPQLGGLCRARYRSGSPGHDDVRRPVRELLRLRHRPGTASSPPGGSRSTAMRSAAPISNGFRAPSLHQQFFTTTSTNFIGGLPVDISTVAVDSPVAQALGSTPLKPEKSVNLSLGATANPLRGLTLHRRSVQDQDQGPHRPDRKSGRGR